MIKYFRYPIMLFSLLLGILIVSQCLLASPINVPTNHWSYSFIERFQAKGISRNSLSNIKPYSRDDVAMIILQISKLSEDGKVELSKIESQQLEILKSEFSEELKELGIENIPEYKSIVNWEDGKNSFFTQIGYVQELSFERGTENSRSTKETLQVILKGKLDDSFFFCSDNKASYTTEPLPIWHPYVVSDRYPWSALSDAYVVFRLPRASLQIGKDSVLWGPGHNGVVGLSTVNFAFDLVSFSMKLWKLKLISMTGFARDNDGKENREDVDQKNIYAHRLEYNPYDGICIGWQEVFIYDKLHISLLNPVMPYQMAEDYLGQVGNNTMELDLDLCLLPNTRFYTALFLNDFHPNESFFSYAPNSWATLCGVFIADPLWISDSDFRFEYARVEPWAYSHKTSIKKDISPLTYSHFGEPLGHWIGSNADDLFFETNYYLTKDLKATLSYDRIRTGEIGSSFYDYFSSKSMNKRFIEGITEKKHEVSLAFSYRIFQDSNIKIKYSYIWIKNKQNQEAKLPPDHKLKQDWKEGSDISGNALYVSMTLKY